VPPFFLRTLGGLALLREGARAEPVAAQRKALALLAVLAASGDVGIGREKVMALLWPESDTERARGALKQMLHVLRRQLGVPEAIGGTAELRLDRTLVESDVELFRRALTGGDPEQAVRLYTGPFLDGVHLEGTPDFERWVDGERAELEGRYRETLERLARAADARGEHDRAVDWWRQLQAADRLDAQAAVGLIRALDAAGNRAAALQHARIHEMLLHDELGLGPDPAVATLAERLRSAPAAAPIRPEPLTSGAESALQGPGRESADVEAPEADERGERPAPPSPPHQRWLIGVVVVATILTVVIALAVRGRSDAVPALSERRVAVGVFVNRTGEARLDPVGTMAADWVTRGIARASVAEVFDVGTLYVQGRTQSGSPTEARRLAREHGAGLVVAGNYYRSRDSLYFSANVVDVESGRILRTLDPVGGPVSDPMPAIEEVRQRVTTALASLTDPRAGSFTGVEAQPPHYGAYQEFIRGQDVYWRGGFEESMAHFRRAAELDSSFASAAVWLGVAAAGVMRCDVADSVHLALAPRLERLAETERLTRGITAARCQTDPVEEYRLHRERAMRNPGSSYYQWGVGISARKANRPAEALDALRAIDPERDLGWLSDQVFYWRDLTGAQHGLGDYRGELKAVQRFAQAGPPRLASSYFAARALAGAGRPDEALRALEGVDRLPPDPVLVAGQASSRRMPARRLATPGWVLYQVSTELLAHGHPSAARVAAERAVHWLRSRPADEAAAPEHRWLLARSLELLGRYENALALAAGLVAEDSAHVDYQGTLGTIAARRGDGATARQIDRWLAARPASHPVGLPGLYRARIAAALGEHERALELLEALPHGAHPMVEILLFHSDPAFAALHGNARFEAFVRPRG
jgi:DNA-binding SARP family transcriptional activator/TolB-like protein